MSNPELPWFPWSVRDVLSDSRWNRMPAVAKGCYIQLLSFQWEDRGLPESVREIANLAGLTADDVRAYNSHHMRVAEDRRMAGGDSPFDETLGTLTAEEVFEMFVWPHLEPVFPVVKEGVRANPRLERERRKQEGRRKSQSKGGKLGRGKQLNSLQLAGYPRATPEANAGNPRHRARSLESESESEKEEEDVDVPPTRPAPPVSNPLPPAGLPTADDGRPVHDPPRIRWGDFLDRWNELASAENLPKIQGMLSEGRKRKVKAIMAAMSRRGLDWFEILAGAVRDRRGTWARENRFPRIDQALREEIVDKLVEGFYERDRQASSGQPEHLNRQSDFKPTEGPTRIKIIRPEERR